MSKYNIDLTGVVEIHVHAGPDVRPRKMSAWQLVEKARAHSMQALVLKNHYLPTVLQAATIDQNIEGIRVFGGVTLNYSVGGLNAEAVEKAIAMQAKIIWMPTHDAENERAYHGQTGTGISILNDKFQLKPEVHQLLEVIEKENVALATGHLNYNEILTLVKEAHHRKISRILINHPGIIFQRFSPEQQKELAKYGAKLEHSYCRPPHTLPVEELAATINSIGAEHIVLGTDLGQPQNPDPVEGMQELIEQLLLNGIDQKSIDLMTRKNPKFIIYED